jgi:hypothetical protein
MASRRMGRARSLRAAQRDAGYATSIIPDSAALHPGYAGFYREIEAMTGQRRELRKRGRPRKQDGPSSADAAGQGDLPL